MPHQKKINIGVVLFFLCMYMEKYLYQKESTADVKKSVDRSNEVLLSQKIVGEQKEALLENLGSSKKTQGIDKVQVALDIIGLEQTVGWVADGTNSVISLFRALADREKDATKKHLFNAAISAVSMIPFADVVKLLKLRKFPVVAKTYIAWARSVKTYAKAQKISWKRFDVSSSKEADASLAAA